MLPAYTIHLRSDSPSVLIEFTLRPGTHARVGSSPYAEITLPLTGLAEIACTIGRTLQGQLYTEVPDGADRKSITLPAALTLPPYQFVIFEPAITPAASPFTKPSRRSKKPPYLFSAVVGLATLIAAGTFLFTIASLKSPAAPRPVADATAPPEHVTTPLPATDPAPAKPAPSPPAPSAPLASAAPTPAAIAPSTAASPAEPPNQDLGTIADRARSAVYEVRIMGPDGQPTASGTAFAISSSGLAVTNHHVVKAGKTFTVINGKGTTFPVTRVAAIDPVNDLALITIDASGIPTLDLGESDSLKIGAPVSVYGTPRGLSGTFSVGILSARRGLREILMPDQDGPVLQISAPISTGSSGSPVFDSTGKVIGVVTSTIAGPTSQNLNFAVPVEAVKKLQRNLALGVTGIGQDLAHQPTQTKSPSRTKSPSPYERDSLPAPRTAPVDQDPIGPDTLFYEDPSAQDIVAAAQRGDWVSTKILSRTAIQRYPSAPTPRATLGLALHYLGDYAEAEAMLKTAIAISPADANSWFYLALSQQKQGKKTDALTALKKAAVLDPESSIIHACLVQSHLGAGDYEEIFPLVSRLREIDRRRYTEVCVDITLDAEKDPKLVPIAIRLETSNNLINSGNPVDEDTRLAIGLASTFLFHLSCKNVNQELTEYADTVKPYLDRSTADRGVIAKEIRAERQRWPLRFTTFKNVTRVRRADANNLDFDMSYTLYYNTHKGNDILSNTFRRRFRFTRTKNTWQITGLLDVP